MTLVGIVVNIPIILSPWEIGYDFSWWLDPEVVVVLTVALVVSIGCTGFGVFRKRPMNSRASFVLTLTSFLLGGSTLISLVAGYTNHKHMILGCGAAESGDIGAVELCSNAPRQLFMVYLLWISLAIQAAVFLASQFWFAKHRSDLLLAE